MRRSKYTERYEARERGPKASGYTTQARGRTRRVHCPDPGTETKSQALLGLAGCGSFNVTPVEDEGSWDRERVVDCNDCGLWFTLDREYPTR